MFLWNRCELPYLSGYRVKCCSYVSLLPLCDRLAIYPQCTHVIVDSADVLSRCHLNSIQKNDVQIANPAFIEDSVRQRRLLDVKNYDPMSPAGAAPPAEKISSSELVLPSAHYVIHGRHFDMSEVLWGKNVQKYYKLVMFHLTSETRNKILRDHRPTQQQIEIFFYSGQTQND